MFIFSVESNNLSPSTLVAMVKSLLCQKYIEEFRASNQVSHLIKITWDHRSVASIVNVLGNRLIISQRQVAN